MAIELSVSRSSGQAVASDCGGQRQRAGGQTFVSVLSQHADTAAANALGIEVMLGIAFKAEYFASEMKGADLTTPVGG
jgi:hypothetical protein